MEEILSPWACLGGQLTPPPVGKQSNHSAPKQKLSYADIARDRLERSVDLSELPVPTMKGNTPVIKISAKSVDQGLEKLKFSLVTRIEAHGRSMIDIKAGIADLWSQMNAKVSPLGKGYLLVRFDMEADYKKVKFGGPWRYGKQLLRLTDWLPNFNVERQTHSNALVWVKFPGLSLEYWEVDILMSMARTIGTPVHVDRNTLKRDNGFYASVLVDMDLSKASPSRILVEVEDKSIEFWQEVTLGAIPDFCNNCKVVGHLTAGCRFLSPLVSEEGAVKDQERFTKVVVNGKPQLKRKRKKNMNELKATEVIDIEPVAENKRAEVSDGLETVHSPSVFDLQVAPFEVDDALEPQIVVEMGAESVVPIEKVQGIEEIQEEGVRELVVPTIVLVRGIEEQEQEIGDEKQNTEVVASTTQEVPHNTMIDELDPPDIGLSHDPTNSGLGSSLDDRLVVSGDEEVVPESQEQLVKEALLIQGLLDGTSVKNKHDSGRDLNDRKLVAKISKKKAALLPPGLLKERLKAMSAIDDP